MKKFLWKLMFWITLIVFWHIYLGSFADGNTDDNYRRFTSKASNIILGDSRAAQAIVPDILNKNFKGKTFDNFALNIVDSPYGEIYLNAIQRKIKNNTKKGIFILTISPWNVSLSRNIKNKKYLPEENSPLNNVKFYDLNPNYEYLFKNYKKSWFFIYKNREDIGKSSTYLHENGWLEVTVEMNPDELAKRIKEKIKFYNELKKEQEISPYRLAYFEKTIQFLQQYGKVYIVRIPASKEMMKIEQKYTSQFNKVVSSIAKKNKVNYFDFSLQFSKFQYTDGNHMYKESGKVFTQKIADSIKISHP